MKIFFKLEERLFRFFKNNAGFAALFLRIAFGIHLIYGTQDNVFSFDRMMEFRDFLAVRNVPYPLFNAFLSVGVQFVSGILLILGGGVRLISALLLVNFVVALLVAHVGDPYEKYFQALQMIAVSLFFLFHGAGEFSLDRMFRKKKLF